MAGLTITGYKYNLSTSTDNVTYQAYAGSYTASSWTSGTTFTISGLTNGTYYKIKIRAVNALGEGAESAEIGPFRPNTVPGTPAAATLTAGDATDTFTWVAPASNGSTITNYYYQVSSDNGSNWYSTIGGTLNGETQTASLSVALATQYKASSYKLRVRAFNNGTNGGFGSYSTTSSSGTGVWASGAGTVAHEDACSTAACTCTAPDCSGGCGSCAACSCDCGTASVTGSVGTRTATAGTSTLTASNTNTRTCYRWTRSGSTASGYIYNQNSTASCSSAYTGCVGRTCSECTAGSCSACSASTCGCSACSGSFVTASPAASCVYATGFAGATSGYYNQNFLGPGYIYYSDSGCQNSVYYGGNNLKGTLDMRYCSISGAWRAYGDAGVDVSI